MARLATGEWTKTKDALLVIVSAFALFWLTGSYVDVALYDLQQAWTTPIEPHRPERHVFRPLDAGLEVTSISEPEPFRDGNYTSSTLSQRRNLFSRANDPGGDNPANRDAFQNAITKGQSLLCRLADASGKTTSPYTALDNLKDWGYDSADVTVQATNTYANTWLAFFQKHSFNIRNQPGQNHLGAFQPTGYNLETSFKHARNTTHDGTTYHATGAEFKNTINVHDGVIIAHHNFGPDFTSKNVAGQKLGFPPGSPIAKLKSWSDAVYLIWQSQTTVDTRKNLKFVLRDHIVNPDTTTIIAQALKSAGYAHTVPPVWPGVTFTPSDDEGKQAAWEALIAAPNVQGVAWLLIQHFEAMGKKTIKSVTVSDQANAANHKDTGSFSANMVIELGERDAPATPPRLARRAFGDDLAKDLKTYQDYTSKGQRLLCNFDDPEGGLQTTWTDPAAIESWGWTKSPSFVRSGISARAEKFQDFFKKHGFNMQNSPQGNNLEVQYKHDRTTTHDGVQYPATGGEFTDTYNVKDGVLIASVNFGPIQASKGWRGQNARFPPGGAVTRFKNWSDGIYLTWKSMTDDQNRSNLKFVIRQSVVNEDTLSVIASAMKSTGHSNHVPPDYPGTTFTRSTTDAKMQTAFEALVGTPNVSGIVWLLVQHWEAMGKKTIKSIAVMDATNPMMAHLDTFQAHIIVELGPASESALLRDDFTNPLRRRPKLVIMVRMSKEKAVDHGKRDKRNSTKAPQMCQRVTRSMTVHGTVMAVLNTAELLERILLQLEPKQIFAAQRVCSQFRDILASSPTLRERCWLRHPKVSPNKKEERWVSARNPHRWVKASPEQIDQEEAFLPVQLNPFMRAKTFQGGTWMQSFPNLAKFGCSEMVALFEAHPVRPAVHVGNLYLDGVKHSILDTYLCSPPTEDVDIEVKAVLRGNTTLELRLEESWRVNGDLTIGGMMKDLVYAYGWSISGPYKGRATLYERLDQLWERIAPEAVCEIIFDSLEFDLRWTVVPTTEEWLTVK